MTARSRDAWSRTWWVTEPDLLADPRDSYLATWVPAQGIQDLQAGATAAALVSGSGVMTGEPVLSVVGRRGVPWGDGSLRLLRVASDRHHQVADQSVAGRSLARVHRATVALTISAARSWVPPDPYADHLGVDPVAQALVADGVRRVNALPHLTEGVCHGDPMPGSFLVTHDDAVALVDWVRPLNAPLLLDVAQATLHLGGPELAEDFLTAYADARGPATRDLGHLGTMVRYAWVARADQAARRVAEGQLDGTPAACDRRWLEEARGRLLGWY